MTLLEDFVERVRRDPVDTAFAALLFTFRLSQFALGAYLVWLGLFGGRP